MRPRPRRSDARWLVLAALLAGCAGQQQNVDWNAIESTITEASSATFVEYFGEDNELVVEVDPGTPVTKAERIACDVVLPAIEGRGGDPSRVTISVFERGSEEILFDATTC